MTNSNHLTLEQMQSSFKNTVMEALQITLIAVDDEQVVLEMPITNAVRQPYGLLHGGVNMVLAETAASVHAAWLVDLSQKVPVGIEINGSHLRSAKSGTVRATGSVVQRSRSLVVHQVEIHHLDTEMLLCTARVTNYYKPVSD